MSETYIAVVFLIVKLAASSTGSLGGSVRGAAVVALLVVYTRITLVKRFLTIPRQGSSFQNPAKPNPR